MRLSPLFVAGLTIIHTGSGALLAAGETHPFSVEDMLAMQRISEPAVSPDRTQVAFTLRTTDLAANRGRTDVWLAPLSGGGARQLTTHDANDSSPRWSADGNALYFLSARSGSNQVWRLDLRGGEGQPVTQTARDIVAFRLSPDGRTLVLAMAVVPGHTPDETAILLREREQTPASGRIHERLFVRHWDTWKDGTRQHLFAHDLASGATRDLMPDMDADCPLLPFGGPEDFTISPDGTTVVFAAKDVGREEAWSTNIDLFSVPLDGSSPPRRITDNRAADVQPLFSPTGDALAYLAMARPGYESDRYRVVVRPWPDGEPRELDLRVDDSPRGDRSPKEMIWSADGRALLLTADDVGETPLFRLDVATGTSRRLVAEGTVVAPRSLGDTGILLGRHSLAGPTELFTCDRDGSGCARVTRINDERLARARLGTFEQFSFAGHGQDTVYGYLVYPVDFEPQRRYPVALLVHGGPQGSFSNDFHYRWNPQAYAGAGYAVLTVDFHGSTGYGQAFTDAIRGDWGGAPYEDIMKGLDHALDRWPFLDGSRVGALGASYGAYMVSWIAGRTDRFACLVSHDGNLDERMAYYDTEELWFPEWEHGGTPWDNPEGYARHNPIDHAGKWSTPMLVVHGALDFRVVDTQGLSTFTALQRRGIPSKLLYFPDENHWVLKPANSLLWHHTVIDWLDRWLEKKR